jgi:hypothetical protein
VKIPADRLLHCALVNQVREVSDRDFWEASGGSYLLSTDDSPQVRDIVLHPWQLMNSVAGLQVQLIITDTTTRFVGVDHIGAIVRRVPTSQKVIIEVIVSDGCKKKVCVSYLAEKTANNQKTRFGCFLTHPSHRPLLFLDRAIPIRRP